MKRLKELAWSFNGDGSDAKYWWSWVRPNSLRWSATLVTPYPYRSNLIYEGESARRHEVNGTVPHKISCRMQGTYFFNLSYYSRYGMSYVHWTDIWVRNAKRIWFCTVRLGPIIPNGASLVPERTKVKSFKMSYCMFLLGTKLNKCKDIQPRGKRSIELLPLNPTWPPKRC